MADRWRVSPVFMMTLRIYNSQSHQKESFIPLHGKNVGMYVCGVTVYDECHIGHARVYITFDYIRRYLRTLGYQVTLVQNFTDVDDKIIVKARLLQKEQGGDLHDQIKAVTAHYTQRYFELMDALLVERADCYPCATEHIDEMIAMIQTLLDKNLAYESDGDVYFSVKKCKEYGKLSGKNIDDLIAGARGDVSEKKHDVLDFALWKKAKPEEPSWSSPWGEGRPAWHIECSAMSQKYLGDTFDIHGGGLDLIFPHHENEIAQSEGCTGKLFVKYWVHNGYVTVGREKMSKSLKNYFLIKDLLEEFSPDVIRFYILSTHYRSPIEFSVEHVRAVEEQLRRAYESMKNLEIAISLFRDVVPAPTSTAQKWITEFEESFHESLSDDFNTAGAIGHLFVMIRNVNILLAKIEDPPPIQCYRAALESLRNQSQILGLLSQPWQLVLSCEPYKDRHRSIIQKYLKIREEARKRKDWDVSDRIRDVLCQILPDSEIEDRKPPKPHSASYSIASYKEINEPMIQAIDEQLADLS